jgi:hypothetical protein
MAELYCLLSIIGSHAGEEMDTIFNRKIGDITKVGKTFWLVKSYMAKPPIVQEICKKAIRSGQKSIKCYFITPSTPLSAAPTKTANIAKQFSYNQNEWEDLPEGIGPVTGNINSSSYALVLEKIVLYLMPIDLTQYAFFVNPDIPIRMKQGASTICAIQKNMRDNPNVMKSYSRTIVAVGTMLSPYCVWLR